MTSLTSPTRGTGEHAAVRYGLDLQASVSKRQRVCGKDNRKASEQTTPLSKLPPAERLKHERFLERKRVARQKRAAARRAPGSQ